MKALHINRQGRLKSYSHSSDRRMSFDMTREDSKQPTSYLFDLMRWEDEGKDNIHIYQAYGYEAYVYDDMLASLYESPAARALVNFAGKMGWCLTARSLEDAAYDLESDQKILVLNDYHLKLQTFEKSGYFRHAFMLALVKGLRDIWHSECRQPYAHGLSVESILLLERVRTADCDVMALLVAWELRGEGLPEIWRHLIGAPEGDMAMRFSRTLERSPEKLFDGSALIDAFYQWFENESRVSACDHQTLEMIDETLEDTEDKSLYGCDRPSPVFIESLSRLADKRHYLASYGHEILQDPLFAGLHDELNQIHYMQIRQELETVTIGAVSFRDAQLATRIFPEGFL